MLSSGSLRLTTEMAGERVMECVVVAETDRKVHEENDSTAKQEQQICPQQHSCAEPA